MEFKNTFRVESSRLKEWDYSNPWWYYITINTKNHVEFFGDIAGRKMKLNHLGLQVEKFWREIPVHFDNTELDYSVIMPNHIHGIVIINSNVKTPDRASLQNPTLGQIVNQFKGSVKRWANKNGFSSFAWQSRYYDHIIRNEKELYNIRRYIVENPLKWAFEKNNIENICEM